MSELEDFVFEYDNLSESGSDDHSDEESVSDESEDDDERTDSWQQISTIGPNMAPPPRFQFKGVPGCTFNANHFEVLDYFQLFFDNDLINFMIAESNRYAEQQTSKSSDVLWLPITTDEMKIVLCIYIIQGIIKKPEERMYWTTKEIFNTPIFPKLMTLRRYLYIKNNWHFLDKGKSDPHTCSNCKLNKMWPVYEAIKQKFSRLYIPERDVSIYDNLVLCKDRLGWDQSIPMKPSRFGIKIYMLCESNTGYLYSFFMYTGKRTIISEKYKHMPRTSQIVLALADSLLGMGYCITTGHYYTSPQLADFLISKQTDLLGLLRSNRKDLPLEFSNKKIKKGESLAFKKSKVMVMKWQDKREICLLSTVHNPEKVPTTNKDKEGNIIKKPRLVVDYNNTKRGIDRLDQHLHDYQICKKRGKTYNKLFMHLVDFVVYNSFILYKKNEGTMDNLDFRSKLVEEMIEKYHSSTYSKTAGPPKQPGLLRLTERHFPDFIPPTEKKAFPYRNCAICCSKKDNKGKKIRKETRYWCSDCKVGLCVVPCFKIYHTQLKF